MKNVSIFGVHGKIRVLGEGEGGMKNQYIGGYLKNWGRGAGLEQSADLRGGGS